MWPNRETQLDQKHLEMSCPLFARSYWKHHGKSKGDFILPNILPKCSCHFAHLKMGQKHSIIRNSKCSCHFAHLGMSLKPFKNYHRNYKMISGMTIQNSQLWLRVPSRQAWSRRGVTGVSLFVSDLGNHGWRVDRKATPDSMVGLKAQDHGSEVAEEWVISMPW